MVLVNDCPAVENRVMNIDLNWEALAGYTLHFVEMDVVTNLAKANTGVSDLHPFASSMCSHATAVTDTCKK